MKVETIRDLVEWTRQTHRELSQCLRACSRKQEDTRAKWLLEYLAEHEKMLAKAVAGFEKEANSRALQTWVYDYVPHTPVEPHKACHKPYDTMDFQEIETDVFAIHNQIIDLHRDLAARAHIPEASELVGELLSMEEHQTMLLAQQANRLQDL